MEIIGNVFENRAEMTIEWKIKNFSSLSEDIDSSYYSPKFCFSGSSWQIGIYPNGETSNKSDGWIILYVRRVPDVWPVTVNFVLSLKTVNGKIDSLKTCTQIFGDESWSWGWKIISKSELMERKSDFFPSDTLTVICTLKNEVTSPVSGSLCSRHQKLSDDFKQIYQEAKKTDFQVKVDGQNISAHRLVLEARSPVFAAMLTHDTKENQTGEVSVIDVNKKTLEILLNYVYSGAIHKLTTDDALSLYAAAEKYDLKEVKEICSQVIIRSLSVENVCNIIKFSDLYQDKEIGRTARDYFKENADKILETNDWENFVKENHTLSIELLATVVKTMFKK